MMGCSSLLLSPAQWHGVSDSHPGHSPDPNITDHRTEALYQHPKKRGSVQDIVQYPVGGGDDEKEEIPVW